MERQSAPVKHPIFRLCARISLCAACWVYIAWHLCDNRHSGPLYAQAYLDPGTGTMIVSAIVGIFATIALGAKTIWYKIRAPFRKKGAAKAGAPPSRPLQDK